MAFEINTCYKRTFKDFCDFRMRTSPFMDYDYSGLPLPSPKQRRKKMKEPEVGSLVVFARNYENDDYTMIGLVRDGVISYQGELIVEDIGYINSYGDFVRDTVGFDTLDNVIIFKEYRLKNGYVSYTLGNENVLQHMINGIQKCMYESLGIWKVIDYNTHTIQIDGKTITISEESYKKLKESLT